MDEADDIESTDDDTDSLDMREAGKCLAPVDTTFRGIRSKHRVVETQETRSGNAEWRCEVET